MVSNIRINNYLWYSAIEDFFIRQRKFRSTEAVAIVNFKYLFLFLSFVYTKMQLILRKIYFVFFNRVSFAQYDNLYTFAIDVKLCMMLIISYMSIIP